MFSKTFTLENISSHIGYHGQNRLWFVFSHFLADDQSLDKTS